MTKMSVRIVAPLAVLALTLAGCAGDADTSTGVAASTATEVGTSDVAGDFNDADVVFVQSMVPHHEQAIEMADIALDPTVGAGPEIVDLATRIKGAQDPEVQQMTGWLETWGQPLQMDSAGHDMSTMEGMMSAEDLDSLATLTGPAFDQMWGAMMIEHHRGAIAMAETVQAEGVNTDVQSLAEDIIVAQQAEIEEMEALLQG